MRLSPAWGTATTATQRLFQGRHAAQVSEEDQRLLRVAGAAQFVAGAGVLALVTALPGASVADPLLLRVLALCGLLAAWITWKGPDHGSRLARASVGAALLYVATICSVSQPLGAAPLLLLWPVFTTAYFLGRRDLAAVVTLSVVALAAGLQLNPSTPPDALPQLVGTTAIIGSASLLIVLLRERIDHLIGDLQRTASTDGLTGIPNRRTWNEAFEREIERARRTGTPLSVALFDIDRFKAINDCFGHAEGDKALIRFAQLLATECRTFDVPGRLGGEEFGLLLVGSPSEGAAAFASRLRRRLELVTQHDLTPFTVSCGIAELDVHGHDAEALLLNADRALYRAKNEGRDRFIVAGTPQVEGETLVASAKDDALEALAQSAEQLSLSVTLKLDPQPQAATTLGFSTLNPAPVNASTKSISDPST